jgi:hypothetical protein
MILAALMTCLVTFAASSASAQTTNGNASSKPAPYIEKKGDAGSSVWFPDDNLATSGPSMYGDTIRRPPGVIRVGLLQPRVSFVPQMLKSVENL